MTKDNGRTLRPGIRASTLSTLVLAAAIAIAPTLRAQEAEDLKCGAAQLMQVLKSGVIPDMIGCDVKRTAQVLRRADHVPEILKVSAPPPEGMIVVQSPDPKTKRRSDTHITLQYSDGTVPEPKPNITVTMTLQPPAPYRRAQEIKYGVVVKNPGPSAFPIVGVDMGFKNLTFLGVSGACLKFPCDISPLPADSNASIFVSARINNEASFSTQVTVRSKPADADTSDNVASISEVTEPLPDTSISGSVNPPPLADISITVLDDSREQRRVGDYVNYRIQVHNAGPNDATNVGIIASEANISIKRVDGQNCTALPCTIHRIAAGADESIKVTAVLGSVGRFTSIVRAVASVGDPDRRNNAGSFGGTVVPRPPPVPWPWVAIAAMLAASIGLLASPSIREWRWRRLVEVTPSLDLKGACSVGPIKMAAPPVEIDSWLEMGNAMPTTPIQVTQTEV